MRLALADAARGHVWSVRWHWHEKERGRCSAIITERNCVLHLGRGRGLAKKSPMHLHKLHLGQGETMRTHLRFGGMKGGAAVAQAVAYG
jgi:hypothetical protein